MIAISPDNLKLLQNKDFSSLKIIDFCAKQLGLAPELVVDALVAALPEVQRTKENTGYISAAMNYTVNASGATILFVNTTEGLQLVFGNSQRRKKVISHNGTCEVGESMEETALREFREELGNPDKGGILFNIANNPQHYKSLAITNNIGDTAEQIASKIVYEKANKAFIYFNMSLICCNDQRVKYSILCEEVRRVNERLSQVAPYYQPTVALIYGDRDKKIPKADLHSDSEARLKAISLVNDFKKDASSMITPEFSNLFNQDFAMETDEKVVEKALKAMIDLTETDKIGFISKAELNRLLQSDVNTISEQGYFKPSFKNLVTHQGKLTSEEFLGQLDHSIDRLVITTASEGLQFQSIGEVKKPRSVHYALFQPEDNQELCLYDSGELIPLSRTPYPGVRLIGELPVNNQQQQEEGQESPSTLFSIFSM